MEKQRKHYTPEERVAILRRHCVEGAAISDLCDDLGLQPTVFCPICDEVLYLWSPNFPRKCCPRITSGLPTNRKQSFTSAASGAPDKPGPGSVAPHGAALS